MQSTPCLPSVVVSGLNGDSHTVAIAEADTLDDLIPKVCAAMSLPPTVELYLAGEPIEAGLTLADQGISDGMELEVVVAGYSGAAAAAARCD